MPSDSPSDRSRYRPCLLLVLIPKSPASNRPGIGVQRTVTPEIRRKLHLDATLRRVNRRVQSSSRCRDRRNADRRQRSRCAFRKRPQTCTPSQPRRASARDGDHALRSASKFDYGQMFPPFEVPHEQTKVCCFSDSRPWLRSPLSVCHESQCNAARKRETDRHGSRSGSCPREFDGDDAGCTSERR